MQDIKSWGRTRPLFVMERDDDDDDDDDDKCPTDGAWGLWWHCWCRKRTWKPVVGAPATIVLLETLGVNTICLIVTEYFCSRGGQGSNRDAALRRIRIHLIEVSWWSTENGLSYIKLTNTRARLNTREIENIDTRSTFAISNSRESHSLL